MTPAQMTGEHDAEYSDADHEQMLHDILGRCDEGDVEELCQLAEEALTEQGMAPRSRFQALAAKPAAKGAHDPDALAAWIGRKKYGRKGMAAMAAAGHKAAGRSRNIGMCTRAFDFEASVQGGDGRTLEGYAAVFNSPARIRDLQGDFDETILPGAFKRSIERRTPVLQWDHGKDPRVGTAPIGKIEQLAEDDHGLHVRARLFGHSDIDRVREAIAEGAVSGMSFRFGVPKGGDTWSARTGDVDLREISDTDIHELGPVVFPAYDTTSVSVRSILAGLSADETRELVHELAAHLRDAVDLQDLAGRSGTRRADGGDPSDVQPRQRATRNSEPDTAQPTHEQLRLQERALQALGVL